MMELSEERNTEIIQGKIYSNPFSILTWFDLKLDPKVDLWSWKWNSL